MLFKNVASQGVYLFLIDSGTGAGKTGDGSNISATISLDGGATSASTNSVSEIGGGVYTLTLTQGETNADRVAIIPSSSTASVVGSPIIAYTTGGAVPAAAAGASTGLALTSSVDDVETKIDTLDTVADGIATTLGTAGAGLTDLGGFSTAAKGEINAEADTALSDYDGPTKAELDTAFTEIKGASWATTDTLEAIRDRGDAAWVTATGFSTHSAADVWSVGTRTLSAFGFSVDITTIESTAATTALETAATASLNSYDSPTKSELDTAFDEIKGSGWATTDTLEAIRDRGDAAWITATGFNTTTPPTAAAISDAVWDELQSGHTTSGTFGYYLDAQVSASSSPPTAAAIADAVWDELSSGHSVSGSYGKAVADGVTGWATATGFSTFDASTDSVTVGTNNDKTGYSISGTLQTLDSLNDFDPASDTVANVTTTGSVTSGVTVSAVSDGAIGADAVADIFSTTAIAENYATDGSAGTPAQLLYQVQQALTEFAISSTTLTVKQLDGSTTAATYTLDSSTAPTTRTRAT